MIDLFKALSNEHRTQILQWLKKPHDFFPFEDIEPEVHEFGVCMSVIQKKVGLSQSTTSAYLSTLVQVGLLVSVRHGQWTYYKRNEKKLAELAHYIQDTL